MTQSIASFLGSPGPFYRSVSIERDRDDLAAARNYVLTPWLERSAVELLESLCQGSTRRAWRIVGDFGVGKSALALALVQALDPRTFNPDTSLGRLASAIGSVPRMYPLLLSGSRDGLQSGLAAAVEAALARNSSLVSKADRKRIAVLADPFDALVALRDAITASGDFDGLLLVIDEMGKFLEAASSDPEHADIFRLQALAELAARSGDRPLGVMLIMHQGLQSYAEDQSIARRTEWMKVSERFDELVFDHPLSHTAALVSAALNVDEVSLPENVRSSYAIAVNAVRDLGWLGPRDGSGQPTCYPLHPATVPVMARFFAAFGQNERSLFGFVASGEPNGLRAFAAGRPVEGGLYRTDNFFDYVSTSFGNRLVARGGVGDWARIRAVLEGAAEAGDCETAVLKTIGLLNLLDAPDLTASEISVAACLCPSFDTREVAKAIKKLRAGGLLFERSGRSGLRLWTSRRVDLSMLWEEGAREVSARGVAANLTAHLASLPLRDHLFARRHSIETGTNRRFEIRLVSARSLAVVDPAAGADGSVICILCGDAGEFRHAKSWAAEATERDPATLALVAPPIADAAALMTELLRYRWIATNAAALQEDAYAAAEVERGIADLESRLVGRLEEVFGLGGTAPISSVRLYRSGRKSVDARPAHIVVSQVCDDLFDAAPLVENELVNRHALTSAGAGARQRLIEGMFERGHVEDMGFGGSKYPPERALYLSVMLRGRVHRQESAGWVIARPDDSDDPLRLRPALIMLETMMSGSGDRVAVPQIYEALAARPYGVRAGLAPLLLATILVANRHRIALFERGTYCPKLDGPAFMRILKAPENFSLQWVSLEGVRAEVFRRLAFLVEAPDAEEGLMAVVAPLVRFGADLPFFVQRTTAMSPHATAVRDALGRAKSPVDLVFRDLPLACGVPPFDPEEKRGAAHRAGPFAELLETAIAEIRGCYPGLLERMREEVATCLTATGKLRTDLEKRASSLVFRIQEQALRTFALRLADGGLLDDTWIEALGGAVVGKPPARWLTADVAIWRSRLEELASSFKRVEAAAFGSRGDGRDAVRVALTHVDGREHAVVVDFHDAGSQEDLFAQSLIRTIEENGVSLDRMLARLSLHALRRREKPEDDVAGSSEENA